MTIDILHEIDKIVVHYHEEVMGKPIQKVEIYYKMIGHIEISKMTKPEQTIYIKNLGHKKKSELLNTIHSPEKITIKDQISNGYPAWCG